MPRLRDHERTTAAVVVPTESAAVSPTSTANEALAKMIQSAGGCPASR